MSTLGSSGISALNSRGGNLSPNEGLDRTGTRSLQSTDWKPLPTDGISLLNHIINMIDHISNNETNQNHENLIALNGEEDLLVKLGEVFLEIEEQRSKIESVISKSDIIISRHLTALAEAIFDIMNFLDKLFTVKFLFLSKGKHKAKMSNLVHNIRLRTNQVLATVSLELTTMHQEVERQVQVETDDSLCILAHSYLSGFGGSTKNYVTAYEKFSELAERGHPESMYVISEFYKAGLIVSKDDNAARDWLHRSSDAGYPKAKCALALEIFTMIHSLDGSVDLSINKSELLKALNRSNKIISPESVHYTEYLTALDLMSAAADRGYADAYAYLGSLLEHEGDFEKALHNYERGYELGSFRAATHLALLNFNGRGGVPSNREKAYKLFEWAMQAGDALGCYNAGLCLEFGSGTAKNTAKAIQAYTKGAMLEEPKSMAALGYLLIRSGIEKSKSTRDQDETAHLESDSNLHKGIYWLNAAAEKHEAIANYYLGKIYEKGIGVQSDYKLALANYRIGSQRNHAKSALCTGNILYWVTKQSLSIGDSFVTFREIASYYEQAAREGIPEAMNSYALLVEDGRADVTGTPDPETAAGWYHLSAYSGYIDAIENLTLVLSSGLVKEYVLPRYSNYNSSNLLQKEVEIYTLPDAINFITQYIEDKKESLDPVRIKRLFTNLTLIESFDPAIISSFTFNPKPEGTDQKDYKTSNKKSNIPSEKNRIHQEGLLNKFDPLPVVSNVDQSGPYNSNNENINNNNKNKNYNTDLLHMSASSKPSRRYVDSSLQHSHGKDDDDDDDLIHMSKPSTNKSILPTKNLSLSSNTGMIPAEHPEIFRSPAPEKHKKTLKV